MRKNKRRFAVWPFIGIFIFFIALIIEFTNDEQWNKIVPYIILILFLFLIYKIWKWLKSYNKVYQVAFSVGFFGLLLLGWVSGAVGIIGSENNPFNLLYWIVPFVIIIGSFIFRFNPHGMGFTLFLTAIIQASVPIIALIISQEVSWGNVGVIGVFIFNSFFTIIFIVSGLLFKYSADNEDFKKPKDKI